MNNDFIEQRIINAIRSLLLGRVNEILQEKEFSIPLICFDNFGLTPLLSLASCERTEKERILFVDAYSLNITINVPETPESELHCFAYSGAVSRAFFENPALSGIADRAVITGKKYLPPKKANCGQDWELIISIRITIEGAFNAG